VEPTTFQLFFAVLTLAANVGTVAVVVVWLLSGRSRAAAEARAMVADFALPLAWLVALTCMLGSLYFSEVANYTPCTLCWYQRIAMYPLAVILGVAVLRRDRAIAWYGVPLAGIGAVIATYHYLIERFPDLENRNVCTSQVPCNFIWFERFGFITLPYMALSGFVFIIVLLLLQARGSQEDGA